MRRDPTEFRKRFAAYKNGKPIKEIYDGGYIKEPVITPDSQYNEYLNSLPDNQRLTPESSYRSRRYWELNDKPKNFSEAIGKGMFNFDFSDMGWHANSVALDEKTGEYEFMKPNWHNTKMYEDAWYYSKDGEDFRNKYTKKAGQAYDKYIPKFGGGKPEYEYVQAGKNNDWSRITNDDMSQSFQDLVVRPKDRGGNTTVGNWKRSWSVIPEPGLLIVSPEFDLLSGIRMIVPKTNIITKQYKPIKDVYNLYKLSKTIDAGVKENSVIEAYNRNPITKDLGTLWDYQAYLDKVFPNSKIKDVLWHGSIKKDLQSFDVNYIGSNIPVIKKSIGMYLSPEKAVAANYGKRGGIYPVLLNTENPFITDQIFGGISKNGVNVAKISKKVKNTILNNNDAIIAPAREEIAFFEPNNALILGSNKDVLGFKSFMKIKHTFE